MKILLTLTDVHDLETLLDASEARFRKSGDAADKWLADRAKRILREVRDQRALSVSDHTSP